MKRILLAAVMSSLLALAAPGVASANHGKRHHHASSHKRHAKRARLITFGSVTTPAPSGPTQTTPSAPTGQPAGKVASFEKGVLTITLTDGSTVSGKVTEDTELECHSAAATTTTGHDDQGGGDDGAGRDSGENGGPSTQAHASSHDEGQQGDDDANEDGGQSTTCTPEAALVKEAVVGEAELKLSSAGAVWEKVELLQ